MRTIYLTADTHTQVTLTTKKLIFALLVVGAISEIQYRLLAYRFPVMFAGNFVLVMLEIAFLTEICLFGKAKIGCHYIRTFLADYFLKKGKGTLNFSSWALV